MDNNLIASGTRVSLNETVFRLSEKSFTFNGTDTKNNPFPIELIAESFLMSSSDEKCVPPHLSVWVEICTTPLQAYAFLQPNSRNKNVYWLGVYEIESINVVINQKIHTDLLQVLWISIDSRLPGYEGHAGIVGLKESIEKLPEKLTNSERKNFRKYLRSQLAEIALKNISDSLRTHLIN